MKRYFLYGLILVFLFAFSFTVVFSEDPIRDREEFGCCTLRQQGTPDYIKGVWINNDGVWDCVCGDVYNPNNCPRRCVLYY